MDDTGGLRHVGFAEDFKWAANLQRDSRSCDVYLSWVVMRLTGSAREKRVFAINRGFCLFITPKTGKVESVLRLKEIGAVVTRPLDPVDTTDRTHCTHEVCIKSSNLSEAPFLFRIRKGDKRNRPLSSDPDLLKRIFVQAAREFHCQPRLEDRSSKEALVDLRRLAEATATRDGGVRSKLQRWQDQAVRTRMSDPKAQQMDVARPPQHAPDDYTVGATAKPQDVGDTRVSGAAGSMQQRPEPPQGPQHVPVLAGAPLQPAIQQPHAQNEAMAKPWTQHSVGRASGEALGAPTHQQSPLAGVAQTSRPNHTSYRQSIAPTQHGDGRDGQETRDRHGWIPPSHVIVPPHAYPHTTPHYAPYNLGAPTPAANQAIVITVEVV